jgi:hypothetical protein
MEDKAILNLNCAQEDGIRFLKAAKYRLKTFLL